MKIKLFRAVIRIASILILIVFCCLLFPAWGMGLLDVPTEIRLNMIHIAPLKLFSEFAVGLIFPLAVLAFFAALLPSRLIRIFCVIGIVCCGVMFAGALLPHSWKANSFPSPFYNGLWEKAKKDSEGSNYEHIELDNNNDQIVFYVKGFGISSRDIFMTLFTGIPSAVFFGELFLRKKSKIVAQNTGE